MNLNITQKVRWLPLFVASFFSVNTVYGQQPEIKVDFNMINRSAGEVQEPGFTPWVVANPLLDSLVVGDVKFFVRKGPRGTMLSSTYYKAGIQTGNFNTRFTNDAVYVKDGDFAQGSQIDLIIRGMPAGQHTLVMYHNATDNLNSTTVCPIDVYVENALVVEKVIPTVRLEKITECATSEIQFVAEEGKDVTISYIANTEGDQPVKNVYLNGFQINGTNAGKKSRTPVPAHNSEHLDIPIGGSLMLEWQSAPGALSHDIYFGTDSAGVAEADRSSPFYKGNQALADTSYQATNLYTGDAYYWRIDEVDGTSTYKGNTWHFRTRQLAFPGAEGYGRFARGGRGGIVVHVTNLRDDNSPGSLRYAIENVKGPRTIVFDVSGVIQLTKRLVLKDPYVTVAGQTAPGKGICIRTAPFGITGNDCIVRNIRLRLGAGPTYDGMGLTGANNSIIDHCSISWTIDEGFSSRGGAKNITLQRTLISEALNAANHQNYPAGSQHGYAATIGGNVGSFHHNLLAHCYGRNWSMGDGLDANANYSGRLDIRNNVVYNWGNRTTDGGVHEVNFVNNYYKPGAASQHFYAFTLQHEGTGNGTQRAYFDGNVMPGRFDENNQEDGRRDTWAAGETVHYETFVPEPFFESYVNTQTALHAYKLVLSDVGANQPVFDDHDIRMISETINGTFSARGSVTNKPGLPDHQDDVGGYENYPEVHRTADWDTDQDGLPDWWENIIGTNPNSGAGDFSDANADTDRDGFTHLDTYLQWMAEPHYNSPLGQEIDIDLKALSRGFTSGPTFSTQNVVNGEVAIHDGIAKFTPDAAGLSSFEFTVVDSDGHDMTRKVNVISGFDITLPVILIGFEARRQNPKDVLLTWKTAQERNNSHFEILRKRSSDTEMKNIGVKVNSKSIQNGDSNTELNYNFTDQNDASGDTYYQIKQLDRDGKETLSDVKVVKGTEASVSIWPIPNNGTFYLKMGADNHQQAVCKIYDLSGREVLNRSISGTQQESFTLTSKGVHILKIFNEKNEEVHVEKIVSH